MKRGKSSNFLKPRLFNVLLTIFVLCLPILREKYNNGQHVTYYRPIVVIIDYFQHFQQPHLLLVMAIFILIIYFFASLITFFASKFMHKNVKRNWTLGFLGFLGFLGIPGIFTQDWKDLLWILWFIWFFYFIPQKKT